MTITRSDSELQHSVLDELSWDTRVGEHEVGVQVDGNTVTLTGTVDSWAKRAAAEEAAHRVVGVLDVANDIRVKLRSSKERTDTDLAKAVRHALEWDVFVPDRRIRTTVADGWVTLEGDVDSWNQRDAADKAVRNLTGVRVVVNRIVVKPDAFAGDVRAAILEALSRHAARAAEHLDVDVVRLTGCVDSTAEKHVVLGAALRTHGVRSVDDHLAIRSSDA